METLEGKTILVTGSAKRIGKALAISAAKVGANVIIHHAHSPAEAEAVRDEIIAMGQKAWVEPCDFNDLSSIPKFIQSIFSNHSLYALVNSAAIFHDRNIHQTAIADWQEHLNVNLTAPFLLSQAFAKHLQTGATGRIINIVDWRALRPAGDHLAYTVSKAALVALTKSLAVSLAPQISVNAIALGAILPPSDGGKVERVLQQTPHSRLGTLKEVEDTLFFLLNGPTYITGETIHLDGGRHLI